MALHWNAQRQAWEDICSRGDVHLGKGQASEAFIKFHFFSRKKKKSKNDKILATKKKKDISNS